MPFYDNQNVSFNETNPLGCNININNTNNNIQNIDHPNNYSSIQQLPTKVLDMNRIRVDLGFEATQNLTEFEILSRSADAISRGKIERKISQTGQIMWSVTDGNLIFVLSEGFGAIITIVWNQQRIQTVGDHSNNFTSTFPNTNMIYLNQQPPLHQQTFGESNLNGNTIEGISDTMDYDVIVDDLITLVDEDNTNNQYLPPLPQPQPLNTSPTAVCGEPANYHSPPMQPQINQFGVPQISQISQNMDCIDCKCANCTNNSPPNPLIPYDNNNIGFNYGSNGHIIYGMSTTSSSFSGGNSVPTSNKTSIKISNILWQELRQRFKFRSKQSLMNKIETFIAKKRKYVVNTQCVWVDSDYVYITKRDMSTLVNIMDFNSWQKRMNNSNLTVPIPKIPKIPSNRKLVRSNSSKRSVFSCDSNTSEYHTIYLKPIIERMKNILYNHLDPSNYNNVTVDTDYIIDIVHKCINLGKKRQISKRTFEFKWDNYTIIMSKSLKTILDVTLSTDKNIITVHPDVVSIISKKCSVLDYFTIQKLANMAKLTKKFTTKKK